MKEMLEIIIKNLVANPDQVEITETEKENAINFSVKVADSDMGKVIGKQGRIAKAIRTVAKAIATKENKKEVKYSKNMVLLKLKGIDDINVAENYRNCYLKIDRKNAVELPEDTYFIVDLLDMEVETEEGETLGKIIDVYPTGSNDIYVVKNEEGKQILLPAISQVVKTVDIQNKKMIVHLLNGLI